MLKRIDNNLCFEENISVLFTVNIWDKMEKFGSTQHLWVLSAFLIAHYEFLIWILLLGIPGDFQGVLVY